MVDIPSSQQRGFTATEEQKRGIKEEIVELRHAQLNVCGDRLQRLHHLDVFADESEHVQGGVGNQREVRIEFRRPFQLRETPTRGTNYKGLVRLLN